MKVMVILIAIGALGTVSKEKRLEEMEIRGRNETVVQYCWDQPEYWVESWKPEQTCCHSDSIESRPAS